MHGLPSLKRKDKVAIVAPAGRFDSKKLAFGLGVMKNWGLDVQFGANLSNAYHKFSATDSERLSDLQWAIDDDQIKAIFCVRGGYGTIRIVDQLDFTRYKDQPKWLIGFSDITVLHNYINLKLGLPSIHGPMPGSFVDNEMEALESLENILFRNRLNIEFNKSEYNTCHELVGEIIGGNLSIVQSMIGKEITPEKLNGKILFIEEVDEYLYHIERMLISLKRAGILQAISGLLIGDFSDIKDNKIGFDRTVYGLILGVCNEFKVSVICDCPSGHISNNQPLVFGLPIQVSTKKNRVSINWPNPIS